MKKLFTLALIGVFSTILTSCSNTAGEQIQEPINQVQKNDYLAKSVQNKTMSDEELIEIAINTIKSAQAGNNKSIRGLSEGIEPTDPNNPTYPTDPPIYEENGIICHTPYNQNSGSACVLNSSGNLVRVTWSLEMTDIGPGGSGGNGQTPIEPRKVYVGTVVRTCNC